MSVNPTEFLVSKNLTVGYRSGKSDNILFEDLNLVLRSGQLVCFMGPNGVGKSTLIRTLAGLQKKLAGDVHTYAPQSPLEGGIRGVSLSSGKTAGLESKIAVVLTDKVASANMTARELITFGRYPYLNWNIKLNELDHQAIEQAISITHVDKIENKKLYELSDGQLQMVMIARALAQETTILLLDEPTAHLDLNNRVEIMNLLRTVVRKNEKAVLVATHELDLALQTADLIWLTGKNKNILTGIPEDLVLNGVFDEIFQFKGFDLKTGKVEHEAWRGITVGLVGEGPEYLWTKNALERSGLRVVNEHENSITVGRHDSYLTWSFRQTMHTSLASLLDNIIQ